MKIIIPGELPQNKVYKATCRNCKGMFEFTREEALLHSCQRNGSSLVINCPTRGCNKEVWVNL